MNRDEKFMSMALFLAEQRRGRTSPNPTVGCVIVKDGRVVGQGNHVKAGCAHAEVVALKQAGNCAKGATLYVTLEPCTHYGKTPPCVDAIVSSDVKRVVIGCKDPNLKKSSIPVMRKAGIEIALGVHRKECEEMNEHFFHYAKTKTPFITLKLAMSQNGKITNENREQIQITGKKSQRYVHYLRTLHDAVMVGSSTVKVDNPQLTARLFKGKDPFKIVVDSTCSLPLRCQLLKHPKKLIILTTPMSSMHKRKKLKNLGAKIIVCKQKNDKVDLRNGLQHLATAGVQSVLCEGGALLAQSLVRSKLVNKGIFLFGPVTFGKGIMGISRSKIKSMKRVTSKKLGKDKVIEGYF